MSDLPFVSFAQNFEDVMLWRALKHVGPGFYIDVGANSPTADSVTAAFYSRGWRGVNIEPNPDLHAELQSARPRDVNLLLAIADKAGTMTLHKVSNAGLSTLDEREALARRDDGFGVEATEVHVDTLGAVWSSHVPRGHPVHFLKIDVEGYERQVIEGNDWNANRPWILVVEATRPMSITPAHDDWESVLTAAGYLHVYFDGLNRFYVAREYPELLDAFRSPPNVFDGFVRLSEVQAQEWAAQADARATAFDSELAAMRGSRSWRVTAPLRRVTQATSDLAPRLRALVRGSRAGIARTTLGTFSPVMRTLRDNPRLKHKFAVLKRVPGLEARYRRLDRSAQARDRSADSPADLSPRARAILRHLQAFDEHGSE